MNKIKKMHTFLLIIFYLEIFVVNLGQFQDILPFPEGNFKLFSALFLPFSGPRVIKKKSE